MKYILVSLLTPVYIIIQLVKSIAESLQCIANPVAEGINELLNNMYEFWKKIFKWEDE